MDTQQAINFLFAIATEIKRSFASPVILVTMKDYSENIFKSLLDMRTTLLQGTMPLRVADIISTFHLDWLQAVSEIEAFKKRTRDTPREHISNAIEFSIECANRSSKHFIKYIKEAVPAMTPEKAQVMQDDLEILSQMHYNLISSLRDKQKSFSVLVDPIEYNLKVLDETEELLNWLDSLNDNLAIQFSQVIDLKLPDLTTDLTKTLRQIIDEVATSTNPKSQQLAQELENKSKSLSLMVGVGDTEGLDIKAIHEKIKNLEDRIERLKREDSSAVMALQHKTIYLEERILSLENLRNTLLVLKNKSVSEDLLGVVHIFDHLLPPQLRCRLVEDLMKLWTNAVAGSQESKSIISILSVTDLKEMFNDENGNFTIDKHGRKLYIGDDGSIFQLNERNKLVQLDDDEIHVYFYDECGRYYYNEKNERIYKAHDTASEYLIGHEGYLLKLKEYRNGKEYWYDHLGRYFLNDKGKRIYCDEDGEVYEKDGLGNLVRIRSDEEFDYVECPREPAVSEDNTYLQRVVGDALKKCIAKVILCQPADPIQFLAKSLEDYRIRERTREARLTDGLALMAERATRMLDTYEATTAPASFSSGEGELSYADPDFVGYQTASIIADE